MSSRETGLNTILPRGHACLPCRRRKLRCDGTKPICNQCVKRDEQQDCEYTIGAHSLTPSQVLEANISLLEGRIRDVEHPVESVKLHPVYSTAESETSSTRQIPISVTSHHPCGRTGLGQDDINTLVGAFLSHAGDLGFFLNKSRFLKAVQIPPELRDSYTESLITVACLWGRRLTHGPIDEPTLLTHSLQAVSGPFIQEDPDIETQSVLKLIQAEILLANYFFTLGRLAEGRYRASAAVSLAIGCRLNIVGCPANLPGTSVSTSPIAPLSALELNLASTSNCDGVQIGERIDGFWTVYALDMAWSSFTRSPSAFGEQLPIMTPWPIDSIAYEQGKVPMLLLNGSLQTFFQNPVADRHSPLALLPKATFLFSCASTLVSCLYENTRDKDSLISEFKTLDGLLKTFTASLILSSRECISASETYRTGFCLTHAASLQLHASFAPLRNHSRERCLAAVQEIVSSIRSVESKTTMAFNPILGVVLSMTMQYLKMQAASPGNELPSDDSQLLSDLLHQLDAIVPKVSFLCPLMALPEAFLANTATYNGTLDVLRS